MKSIRKLLCATLVSTCLFIFIQAMSVWALPAFPLKTQITYLTTGSVGISVTNPASEYVESELYQVTGSGAVLVGNEHNFTYVSCDKLTKNTLYMYRLRTCDRKYDSTIRDYVCNPTSEWTAYAGFITDDISMKLVSKTSKTVQFKFPKITGISNYTFYTSTKKTSGFKKVKTVKGGKSIKFSKVKGKTMTYYKNYYYKIGVKSKIANLPITTIESVYLTSRGYNPSFYIYRTYKR